MLPILLKHCWVSKHCWPVWPMWTQIPYEQPLPGPQNYQITLLYRIVLRGQASIKKASPFWAGLFFDASQ